MPGLDYAAIIISLIAAFGMVSSARASSKASTKNAKAETEKEAYVRAREFDTETIERQKNQLKELREHDEKKAKQIKELRAEVGAVKSENSELRAELRRHEQRIHELETELSNRKRDELDEQ